MNATSQINPTSEWLEADGLGGFASGTVGGFRTRRYHSVLLTARNPPTDRMVLVNGFEASIQTQSGPISLSSQYYSPGVFVPGNQLPLISFATEPWPTWRWQIEDGIFIEQELFVAREKSLVAISWKIIGDLDPVVLTVRPFVSGRDYHSLHHENPSFRFDALDGDAAKASRAQLDRSSVSRQNEEAEADSQVMLRPYVDVPTITFRSNGHYAAEPLWYRQFLYTVEQERGLDCIEDLAAPGTFTWTLKESQPAIWLVAAEGYETELIESGTQAKQIYDRLRSTELVRRKAFPTALHRSADSYLVQRGSRKTIVAGYPWFTDWGRDTFISMRGLCLATGWLDEAGDLLEAWAATVSEGMLPNRFPDYGNPPEYNSADASLWFVIAVYEYLEESNSAGRTVASSQHSVLQRAVTAILEGYTNGTRFGIRCDADGLLAAGTSGVQLTWMDAKVGDWVVTPRIGKPVEIQALWLNALMLAGRSEARWSKLSERGRQSFLDRFWNAEAGCLFDVVDVDHRSGQVDAAVRPNQIFAVGGLPIRLIEGERARQIVDNVETRLLTPLGLRSLGPNSPGYAGHYLGNVRQRDGGYHQGTVWPWLIGSFVDAWVRVRGRSPAVIQAARERFLPPLYDHLQHAGLGHVSEIADAEPPFTPRGCPFQAWSLGELLRLELKILVKE